MKTLFQKILEIYLFIKLSLTMWFYFLFIRISDQLISKHLVLNVPNVSCKAMLGIKLILFI